jgi:hypothetical protein
MSTSPLAAASTKKLPSKAGSDATTTKRVAPQRVAGWPSIQVRAYGAGSGTQKLAVNPISGNAVIKSRKDDDDGGVMVMVAKPVSLVVTGTATADEDGKVLVIVDDETNGIQREVEDLFTASLLSHLPATEAKTSYSTYYGDNLLKLKEKHFAGRFVSKFRNGERDASLKASDAYSGKRVQIVVKYYGAYATNEIYGPLVTVAAFNLLE